MSRKKFSNDLNSLFGFTPEVESFQEENPLLNNDETDTATLVAPKKTVAKKTVPTKSKKSIKRNTKNFHSDLEELFQEAFQEKMEQLQEEEKETVEATSAPEKKVPAPARVRKIRPRMGLDSLIRNTQNLSPEEIQVKKDQKRVTFLYSKEQLEKLREISKKDSRFMKDIIGEAVTQWIEDYKKGIA